MKVRLKIDGTDYSTYLPRKSWTLDDYEGKSISSIELDLEDRACAIADPTALELKEAVLDDPDTGSRHFSGLVTQIDSSPFEGIGLKHSIVIQDWKWLMERYFQTKTYTNTNDSAIISNAFSEAGLAEIDATTYVKTGRVIEKFLMNNMSLRAMMDALCEITGFIWYVDYNKKLVYQKATESVATFIFSDAPDNITSFPYQNLTRTKDLTGIVNAVKVRGGLLAHSLGYYIFPNNGTLTRVTTAPVRTGQDDNTPLPSVDRNTGNDAGIVWTAQTVGNADKSQPLTSYNCLFSSISGTLEWNTAPLNLINSYRVYGRQWGYFAYAIRDQVSIDALGRTMWATLSDEIIKTEQQAYDVAWGKVLRVKTSAREKLTFTMDKDGLRSGMLVGFVNAKLGINKYYSVRRVVTRFLGATLASYTVTMTNPSKLVPDAVDMLAAAYRATQPAIEPREETLVIFLEITEPLIALADATLTPTASTKSYRCMANSISWWPMDEGQGTSIEDRYGSNDLTLTGAPSFVQGKRSYCLELNGTTQYGKKTGAASLPSTAITIADWIYLDFLKSYNVIIAHDKDSVGGWNLNVDASGNLSFTICDGVASYKTGSKSGIVINTWYHVVGWYDGTNVKVFINAVAGTPVAAGAIALDTVGDLYVGADNGPANFLDGKVDDLWLFPTTLSQQSIDDLYAFKNILAGFWKCAA